MALTKCPDCGREISDAAPTCPHCGKPQAAAPAVVNATGGCFSAMLKGVGFLMLLGIVGISGCLILVTGIGAMSRSGSSARVSPAKSGPAAVSVPVLRLESWNWHDSPSGRYVEVNGEVTNISPDKIDSIKAVVTFYSKSGEMVTSSYSFVEYKPLMPGQTSPFRMMESKNTQMSTARLEFTTIWGRPLEWVEKAKK